MDAVPFLRGSVREHVMSRTDSPSNANELLNFVRRDILVKNTFLHIAEEADSYESTGARTRSLSACASSSTSRESGYRSTYHRSGLAPQDGLSPQRRANERRGSSDLNAKRVPSKSTEDRESEVQDYVPDMDGELPPESEIADWSAGCAKHANGTCRPCLYFRTPVGCNSGSKCLFCHFEHEAKVRARPCKTKRMQCKQIANNMKTVGIDKVGGAEAAAKAVIAVGSSVDRSYLATVLSSKARKEEDAREEDEGKRISLLSL